MTLLWVPGPRAPEDEPWPTLGPGVIDFIEDNLVYGPGDLQGEPYRLTDEQKALICCWYEVYPDDSEFAGRRRYKRVVLSLPKGMAKTELAALITIAEASDSGPVRTVVERGRALFDGQGNPIGGPVQFPYIPMLAATESQAEDLAYAVVKAILEQSRVAQEFDIGLERIQRLSDGGRIQALAGAPGARDGALTTFQHFDETHRLFSHRHKAAHGTMLMNIPKRFLADAWSSETTTSFAPGENSIAEIAYEAARAMAEGKIPADRTFFYFHRQASEHHDIKTREGRRDAIVEASGPSGGFRDIEAAVNAYDSPGMEPSYYERVWLNRPVQTERKAFDTEMWRAIAKPDEVIPDGETVVLAFDGSQFDDSTSLSVRSVRTGHSMNIGLWEKPDGPAGADWEVPRSEVDAAVDAAFARWKVWRLYADPPHWQDTIAAWAGRYGAERVVEWWTNRHKAMVWAVHGFVEAMKSGAISHDGNAAVARHIGNACKVMTTYRDENGQPLFYISKERADSGFKIDAAMTEVLSNEARNDAIGAGVNDEKPPSKPRFFAFSGEERR